MTVEAPVAWQVTDDVDVFSDMLRRCYLPFAMTGEDAELGIFSATVQERPLGPLRLVDGITSPHGGIRRARQVSTTPRDVVGLQYVLAGREFIRQRDEVLALGPGDLMVWDTDVSGAYEIVETVRKRTLVVPRSLADALGLEVHTPAMVHVVPGCRLGAIRPLFGLLEVLSANLPMMSLQATERATALVIQMLADVGGGLPDGTTRRRRGAEDLCERVLAYVEGNLGDPALTPAVVAAANFVSIRTLYTVLRSNNIALAAHIRKRRLARCYADLVTTDDPVGDIAARWGFVSLPHFSRAFAKQYGIAPSRLRRPA